jgi:hypothetical protein
MTVSAFSVAVQDFILSLAEGSPQEASARLDEAIAASEGISQEEASWAVLGLVERLASAEARFPALVACLIERAMAAGGDAWIATGLLIERMHRALVGAGRFVAACGERLRAAGLSPHDEDEEADALRMQVAGEMTADAVGFAELDLWCHVAAGLVACFPEARALFRALGGTPELLGPFADGRDGVRTLLGHLEQHAGEPLPTGFPGAALDQALAHFPESLDAETDLGAAMQAFYRALFCVDRATRDRALAGLGERIARCDVSLVGELAQTAGGLVEVGGDARLAVDAILARLPGALQAARQFVTACVNATRVLGREGENDDPSTVVDRYGRQVARQMPAEAAAWQAIEPLCLGAVAHLSRLSDHRQRLRADGSLLPLADALSEVSGPANFLTKMLQVLDDEELVVLAPELGRGWRVQIGGIGDNFQLHTLLAGAIVGPAEDGLCPGPVGVLSDEDEGEEPGRPLSPRAVGAARDLPVSADEPGVWSFLQLWNWTALQPDGRLPDDVMRQTDHFIWNEGVPADVAAFEGTRVVLVGPAPFSRSWNGGRIFHGMRARLDVVETLNPAAVQSWLDRLAAAARH